FNLQGKYDTEILDKIILINIYNCIGVLFSFFSIIVNILKNDLFSIISLFIGLILLLSNFLYLYKTKKYTTSASILITIITSMLLLSIISPNGNPNSMYLFHTYPIITISLLGLKRGSIISLSLLGITTVLFIFTQSILIKYNIDGKAIISFVIAYLSVYLFIYFHEYIRSNSHQRTEKTMFEAQKSVKEKTEFIANLSHQIRTPLNNIIGITSLLNKTSLDAKQQDYIDTIQASAGNLYTVANSINKMSNLKYETTASNTLSFNLNLTISSTLELFSNQKLSNAKFNFNFSSKIPDKLIGDPVVIKQIFLNLIENFIKNKSTNQISLNIEVKIEKDSKEHIDCVFEISSDKPINIPLKPETNRYESIIKQEKVEIDSAKHIELLDLTITKELIKSNGGEFRIVHNSEKTVYSYTLPLKKVFKTPQKNEEKQDDITIKDTTKHLPTGGEKKSVQLKDSNILLVEDNLINQKIMQISLQNIVGNIDIANNGREALDKFDKKRYDLILMDVQMPIMDGIKTTIKLREIESMTNTHTPIIAITANALMGDRESCIEAGMDDYMSKPFQLQDLIDKMNHYLTKK
ncbi:MAG: response regulator, partial [Bacteroidales bacterium]|nr:response regulator [Bacteroidales bacterium]